MRVAVGRARGEESAVAVGAPFERRFGVEPDPLGPQLALEIGRFGVEGARQATREIAPVPECRQLWRDAVGLVLRSQRVVDDLVTLCAGIERPGSDVVPQLDVPIDERDAGAFEADPEILEIVVVAHVGRVDQQPGAGRKARDVAPVDDAARVAGFLVVDQVFDVELAAAAFAQVAQLRIEPDAARRIPTRRERGVVVLGQVPVIRHGNVRAGAAAAADCREQQA